MASKARSKKEFAAALGCITPSGFVNYEKLRKHYLTDDLIRSIGLDLDKYKRMQTIPARYCRRICQELAISEDEFPDH